MKITKPLIITVLLILYGLNLYSQSRIVFTSNDNGTQKFWTMRTDSPMVYHSISDQLDAIAPYQGNDEGPITVSHNGNYYSFLSDRFDAGTSGWTALTIVKSDFSEYEMVKDQNGSLIHSEGQAYVFNNGQAIVYVADFGNHSRDIFVSYKTGNSWSTPLNLTQNSTYDYNYWPYLSADSSKVLFDAGNSTFPSIAIGLVDIDGTNLSFPITTASFSNADEVHCPSINSSGDIIFEAETSNGGEQVWKLSDGETIPTLITSQYTNDNSPIVLPDDKIASLLLPASYHQIKLMDANGSNGVLLTEESNSFQEVYDIGYSACPIDNISNLDITTSHSIKIYPNPSSDNLYVSSKEKIKSIEIYNMLGKVVYQETQIKNLKLDISKWKSSIYLLKIKTKDKISIQKFIKK